MDDSQAYFYTHPPRCLAGFQVEPVLLEGVHFDGHGEACNPTFALACRCGGDHFHVQGYALVNRGHHIFVGPLSAQCRACGETTLVIDTATHGYNPECGLGSSTIRGEGTPDAFLCGTCGTTAMQVFARFEFPDDLFDEGFEEFRGREHDLFTWFSLHGRCEGCSQMLDITEFECA